ncbi:mediator of RNA polymerase II transcription subunit 25-like [Vigna unguiculata]|uniref:mediator of RNA polymerase II transcription subunit 25-like n=1 Tax=Vigna unguiculata TaxID=3917 RepID=UPI001016E2D5|nr:mediator of RNA polymerase II transcription subunit 25-like [Vigna unguiculata]
MAEEQPTRRTLLDYSMPNTNNYQGSIVRPPIQANNFEIKPTLLQVIQQNQFGGAGSEDPNSHLENFLAICDTLKINGVSDDAIRLRPFPFSLRDKAKSWLHTQPQGSICTREDMATKFERYKELLRKCPHHALPDWLQVQIFYNGLVPSFKAILDAASGGSFNLKTPEEALETLELMVSNAMNMQFDRQNRKAGVLEVNTLDAILAQNKLLTQQITELTQKLGNMQAKAVNTTSLPCDFCGGMHQNGECQVTQQEAQVNAMGQQQNQFSTNFSNWRSPLNKPWSGSNQPNQPRPPYQYQAQSSNQGNKMSTLESAVEKLTVQTSTFVEQTSNFMNETRTNFKNQEASIRKLENQIGQLSRQISERPPGTFPSDTVPNPKEQCKAIQLRSGRLVENEKKSEVSSEKNAQGDDIVKESEKNEWKNCEEKCEEESEREKNEESEKGKMREYVPTIPFPQRLKKKDQEKQFARFLDVFKKLHINIPFAEALEQMPSYAKFTKDLLSRKRKLQEDETIMLTEECSAIIQQKLPPKLKDP